MIPLEQAIPQVLRFSGCPGWPDAKEGQDELTQTMSRIAADPAHAQRIANAWLAASHWAPTPYNLTEIARNTVAPAIEGSPCQICAGSGWVPLPARQVHGDSYSSVEPCECRASGQTKEVSTNG